MKPKKIITENFKVSVWNITVGKRYFSFEWRAWRNGKLLDEGKYDTSHSRSPAFMRKILRNGHAVEIVLERI